MVDTPDLLSQSVNLDKLFNDFVSQVEIRLNRELRINRRGRIETEDCIRYVFFDAFRKNFYKIPLEEYHLEYPLLESAIETSDTGDRNFQKIDMCIFPVEQVTRTGLALEFKYDRYNFRNFTQRRACIFSDIFRLVLFHPEKPMRRFFIYLLNEIAEGKIVKKTARKPDAMRKHLRENASFFKMELSTKEKPFRLDFNYVSNLFHETEKNKFRNDFLTRLYGKKGKKNLRKFLEEIKGLDCKLYCHNGMPSLNDDRVDKWNIYIFEIIR